MKLFGLKRGVPARHLGELELAIMEIAWEAETVTARDALERLQERGIALSTVQSTLERLHRKGLLSRVKHGRAYAYRARVARVELIAELMQELSDQFATGRIEPLVSGFLTLVEELDGERAEAVRRKLRDHLEDTE